MLAPILAMLAVSLPALAAPPAGPPAKTDKPAKATKATQATKPGEAESPPKAFEVSGKYAIWGLTQRNFMLGAEHALDDADYVTQMLRIQAKANREHYGVVARLDAAQGWWGADNSPNTSTSVGVDGDGNPVGTTAYNADKLFGSKDTNYGVHVDHAYAWMKIPGARLTARAGRQPYNLGHRLVLDQDLDGVQLRVQPAPAVGVEAWFAKMSEGQGSMVAPSGLLMSDTDAMSDANLFGGIVRIEPDLGEDTELEIQAFGVGYIDGSGADEDGDQLATYLPNGLGYGMARYKPNVSQAVVIGLSGMATLPVAAGLDLKLEGDLLTGKDEVDNTDHAGGLLDINDGELSGWNAWVDATQRFDAGLPLRVGLGAGMGSGDDDVGGGKGNINRIETMGSWHLTNVWEDSVMPDIGGISPQGLGSPVSRGYRELENTTMAQGRFGLAPHEKVDVELSYTWLQATQAVSGFDAAGAPTGKSSRALGQEIDLNVGVKVYKGLSYSMLGGYFMPGDASGLLINGDTDALDAAWEIKHVVGAAF